MHIRSYVVKFYKNCIPQDFHLPALQPYGLPDCQSAVRPTSSTHMSPDFSDNTGDCYLT